MSSKIRNFIHSNSELCILLLSALSSYILYYISNSAVTSLIWYIGLCIILFNRKRYSSKTIYLKVFLWAIAMFFIGYCIMCILNKGSSILIIGIAIYNILISIVGMAFCRINKFKGSIVWIATILFILLCGSYLGSILKYLDLNPLNIAINKVTDNGNYIVIENEWESFLDNFASLNEFCTTIQFNGELHNINYEWVTSTNEYRYIIEFRDSEDIIYTFKSNVPIEEWSQFQISNMD